MECECQGHSKGKESMPCTVQIMSISILVLKLLYNRSDNSHFDLYLKQRRNRKCGQNRTKTKDYVEIIPVVFLGMLIEKDNFRSTVTKNQFIQIWLQSTICVMFLKI